jgi:hypothetical protein
VIALRGLHAGVRPYAEYAHQMARYYGIRPQVTSTGRSWANQLRLYTRHANCVAEGRYPSAPDCLWPANRPGDSSHQYGLSWDSVVPAKDLPLWTAIRSYVGFRVPSHDSIHAEVPGWRQYV